VSITWEEAQEEEAYSRMVDEILASHKDDIIDEFLAEHKDDIINDFLSERTKSYYRDHPNLTVSADTAIEEAQNLIDVSPRASLVFSFSAIEITLRDILLKPVAVGMVHDDNTGRLIAEFVIRSNSFTKLLLQILEHYGFDLKQVTRPGSDKKLWVEIEEAKQIRNNILHNGGTVSRCCESISGDCHNAAEETLSGSENVCGGTIGTPPRCPILASPAASGSMPVGR
jgi:hypothetical protein